MSSRYSKEAPRLDPERFRDAPETFELATVVAEETLVNLKAKMREVLDRDDSLKRTLAHDPSATSRQLSDLESMHWGDLVSEFAVIESCCKRLNLTPEEFLRRVVRELRPPNSIGLFWQREALRAYDHATGIEDAAKALAAERDFLASKQKANATEGGNKKAQKVYGDAKLFVQQRWLQDGKSQYEGNKSAFARVHVKLALQQYGTEVTERTVVHSWLKHM